MSHFEGHFEGGQDFFDPLNCPERSEGQFRGQKGVFLPSHHLQGHNITYHHHL
jgi:hypothetical protein